MLPRRNRVPGFRIRQVLSGQTISREQELIIKSHPNQLNFGRVGVIIPVKAVKRAVDRNRLRRQLLGLIDPQKIFPGFDLVVLIRKQRAG